MSTYRTETARADDWMAASHRLHDFARWLVSMDNSEDEQGLKDRQTVTLTKIIERAKAALDGPSLSPEDTA